MNLPTSVLHFVIPALKSDKKLITPEDIPRQWTAQKQKPVKRSDVEVDEQGWMTPHSETHHKIKEMMREYYDQYDDIRAHNICQKAGVSMKELNLGNACLNYILGSCNRRECTRTRRHPRAEDATDQEVTQLCKKLKKGVNAMTRAKRQRMAESDQDDWSN